MFVSILILISGISVISLASSFFYIIFFHIPTHTYPTSHALTKFGARNTLIKLTYLNTSCLINSARAAAASRPRRAMTRLLLLVLCAWATAHGHNDNTGTTSWLIPTLSSTSRTAKGIFYICFKLPAFSGRVIVEKAAPEETWQKC